MRNILVLFSIAGLLLTVAPAFLYFSGVIEWSIHAQLMFVGMVLWFATAPFWVNPKEPDEV